jgi:hypothetical protein
VAWGCVALGILWAVGAWFARPSTTGATYVLQLAVAVAGLLALGRLALAGVAVMRGRETTAAFARPMLWAFGLAALWWVAVSLGDL